MKNVVTFETAKRLKEAGFPQPNFETGQFWYNDLGALTFVGRKELNETGKHDYFYCTSVESGRTDLFQPIADDAFFAPTAIEILGQLGFSYDLTVWSNDFSLCSRVTKRGRQGIQMQIFDSHNPAKAAALAWLAMQDKKDLQK